MEIELNAWELAKKSAEARRNSSNSEQRQIIHDHDVLKLLSIDLGQVPNQKNNEHKDES